VGGYQRVDKGHEKRDQTQTGHPEMSQGRHAQRQERDGLTEQIARVINEEPIARALDAPITRERAVKRVPEPIICVEEESFGDAIANYLAEWGYRRIQTLGPNGIYTT
jgi:hypothetical protein